MGLGLEVAPSGQWGEGEPQGPRFTGAARAGPAGGLRALPSPEAGLAFPTSPSSASFSQRSSCWCTHLRRSGRTWASYVFLKKFYHFALHS